MRIIAVMLVCVVATVGCGRKATPLATGVPVSTNTVLPWDTEAEVKAQLRLPKMTNQNEVIVHNPSPIDQHKEEAMRLQRMALIDDRRKQEPSGQPLPGN